MTAKKSKLTLLQRSGHIWLIALFALVMVLMLGAVLFGAHVYRMALSTDAQDTQLRSIEGYFSSTFRSRDAVDALGSMDAPEGRALVVYEDGRKYETCIYLHEGKLLEEYRAAGGALDPENATRIADTDQFSFDIEPGNSVRITTGEGTFVCHMRSEGGA